MTTKPSYDWRKDLASIYEERDLAPKKKELTSEDIEKNLRLSSAIYEDVRKEITTKEPFPKYPTGLRDLDEILWGLHKREIVAIGARTSVGKSAFGLQLTKQLIDANNMVVYFSLEMSKEQLVQRLLSNVSEIDGSELRKGMKEEELKEKEGIFRTWIDEVKLLIDDEYGFSFDSVTKICHLMKPDFVVLDYIQMVRTEHGQTKKDAIDNFLIDMKQLCRELNFGVIILSQLNRKGEEQADLTTFKGSGVLEEHPDTCLILTWDQEQDSYSIHVKKQRHGPVGSVNVVFKPEFSMFKDTLMGSIYEK